MKHKYNKGTTIVTITPIKSAHYVISKVKGNKKLFKKYSNNFCIEMFVASKVQAPII